MITRPNFVSNNFDIHVSDVSIESDFNKKKKLWMSKRLNCFRILPV